jgi:hypothetical protein
MDKEIIGQATPEQIAAWKKSHADGIYQVSSEKNGEAHVGYFKNPNRADVNCALSKAQDKDPLAVIEDFAVLTFIGGSELLLKDNQMSLGLYSELRPKMNGIPAKLVNL